MKTLATPPGPPAGTTTRPGTRDSASSSVVAPPCASCGPVRIVTPAGMRSTRVGTRVAVTTVSGSCTEGALCAAAGGADAAAMMDVTIAICQAFMSRAPATGSPPRLSGRCMHAGGPVAPVLPARCARAISTPAGLLARSAGTFPRECPVPRRLLAANGNGAMAGNPLLTVAGAAAVSAGQAARRSAFPFQPLQATGVCGRG